MTHILLPDINESTSHKVITYEYSYTIIHKPDKGGIPNIHHIMNRGIKCG